MPATPARIGFVTEATRNSEQSDANVASKYGNIARDTGSDPIVSYFDDRADAAVAVVERMSLLSPDRRRMAHRVTGISNRSYLDGNNFDAVTARILDPERNLNYLAMITTAEISPDENAIEVVTWG